MKMRVVLLLDDDVTEYALPGNYFRDVKQDLRERLVGECERAASFEHAYIESIEEVSN